MLCSRLTGEVRAAHAGICSNFTSYFFSLCVLQKVEKTAAVDRLTDSSRYTGSHKERFDESGRGRGRQGREELAENTGYVGAYKNAGSYGSKIKTDKWSLHLGQSHKFNQNVCVRVCVCAGGTWYDGLWLGCKWLLNAWLFCTKLENLLLIRKFWMAWEIVISTGSDVSSLPALACYFLPVLQEVGRRSDIKHCLGFCQIFFSDIICLRWMKCYKNR